MSTSRKAKSRAIRVFTNKLLIVNFVLVLSACAHQNAKLNETQKITQIVDGKTILQLQQSMNNKQLTSASLIDSYLKKIAHQDDQYHAIITINPEAQAEAKRLDKERALGKVRGPLHGIPIVIKDNIETKNMPTTAGSLALKDNRTGRDATLIANLKAAGAIILGKTNLSEWANFRSERSSSGWSGVGGQTRNPIDPSRSACGSSSGSGAAIAANFAVAAVGTETDGSITCPSSATGLVGIKPTVGLVSRTGIVPISHSQDTAGPMAKNVTDAAILLQAMRGKDQQDSATLQAGFNFSQDYLTGTKDTALSLKGKRIGLLQSRVKPHEGAEAVYAKAIEKLAAAGAIIVDDIKVHRHDTWGQDTYDVLLYEFKHDLNHYLKTLPTPYNQLTLEKLIAFNNQHDASEMPYFKQEIFEKAQAKGSLTEKEYLQALKRIQKATRQDGLDKVYNDHQLDLLISPTLGPAWSIDQINGDSYTGGYSSFSAVSGYPYLTLTMGKLHHLPLGLSLIGLKHEEKKIIQYALAFEGLFNK